MTGRALRTGASAGTTYRGSLGAALAELGQRAEVHDLYDQCGARIYDDSTDLEAGEIRVLRRVLRRHAGAVLELAAGSGRLTLPLLSTGRPVVALELSSSMIDVLLERAAECPQPVRDLLTTNQADMRDFRLDTTFSLVVLGAASISLLDADGRARTFESVRRHLAPGGCLLFSIAVDAGVQDEDVDVVTDVTGRSGQRYRVHAHRAAGARQRQVGVYPLPGDAAGSGAAMPPRTVPVCVSSHRVLELAAVVREVEQAGLVVRDTHPLGSIAHGPAEVFLEVGAA